MEVELHVFWRRELQIGREQRMKMVRQYSSYVFIYISSDIYYASYEFIHTWLVRVKITFWLYQQWLKIEVNGFTSCIGCFTHVDPPPVPIV
jgi:hypothetical protein